MSDIAVESQVVMRTLDSIKPYERNPRKNDKTVELLCEVIPKVGFNVPIVIDSDGVIVKGHARYLAATKLGMAEVPCIVTHADADSVRADRIADNKISEFSEWVNDELMQEINEMDFDLSDLGLPKIDLTDVPTAETVKSDLKKENDSDRPTITEEQKQKIFEEFRQAQGEAKAAEAVKAVAEFGDSPYYKCVCDKCGYTMFIKEGEL